MRNQIKDAKEMATRREQLLEAGFRAFSENTIEAVTLQQVAKEAGVGVATLYRYFGTKLALSIEIAVRKWTIFLAGSYRRFAKARCAEKTAAEQFDFYLREFERLYRDYKPLLRFNEDFTNYVRHAGADAEQMRPMIEIVQGVMNRAHDIFLTGERDGSLRTELGEGQLFLATIHQMLAVVGKYAGGLLYAGESEEQKQNEIRGLREIIFSSCTRQPAQENEE